MNKEKPIIFNGEMVKAILGGRKTQTRRPVAGIGNDNCLRVNDPRVKGNFKTRINIEDPRVVDVGPYKVGDLLYVRETYMPDPPDDGTWSYFEFDGCGQPLYLIPDRFKKPKHCIHRASWKGTEMVGWKPSIHMPKWATRIWLKVTNVRVERVQDITDADALWEGQYIDRETALGCDKGIIATFKKLWNSIYKNWDENPYVWVFEFEIIKDGE